MLDMESFKLGVLNGETEYKLAAKHRLTVREARRIMLELKAERHEQVKAAARAKKPKSRRKNAHEMFASGASIADVMVATGLSRSTANLYRWEQRLADAELSL